MNNQTFINAVALFILVLLATPVVITWRLNLTINSLKSELTEIKLLIEECEKELPRNQQCVLIAMPEATDE